MLKRSRLINMVKCQAFDARHAMNFFTKPAMSYSEYKQQCVSLRQVKTSEKRSNKLTYTKRRTVLQLYIHIHIYIYIIYICIVIEYKIL